MEKDELFELTNPQKSIWLTEQFYGGTTVNNICTSGTIYGEIDEDLLKQAINNVVKHNDSFRIHIVLENNIAKQYIVNYKNFDIDVEYINDESEIEYIEKQEVKYKFDVINSDLFRFKLAISKNNFASVILTVNHLIADSWSLGLVIQEILRNYNCLKNNEIISQETFSYVDYINSEKEYKSSKKFENDKSYWNEIFETIPEQATIPSLKNNIKNLSYNAKRLSFEINSNLLSKINDFCRKNSISTFNFFMAIFSIYIGRVSNIDDFVIGTPILNRTNFKEKSTTGMFVNTVPVRVNNLNNSTFKSLTNDISTKMMGILRHQKYSYNSVLEDLRAKNENVPNLYNIIISYQVTKAFNEKFGNYKTNWTFNNYCANDFNIHIYDINDTGDLIVNYDYLIDKYSADDVTDVHNRIIHMINQILNNNEINSSDIEIVTPEEKNKILNVFNNTNVDYPKDKTIVDLFQEQVEKTPDNVAVVCNEESLTYRELNEKANSLARYLINQGIKPGTIIGLRLNKRLEMIIGILAIIKCGCCYLPINMQYPQDRVDFMLSDSNARLLLATEDSLTDIEINLPKININLNNDDIYNYDTKNLDLKISPEDLIYIIYTSGSTGKPKGAMLCHRNVVRLFKNDKFLFNFNENDVWTMFHSVAFDFSVWEMYGALLFGGKLVLVTDEVAQDPELFLNLMRKQHVTVLNQTPTYFYKLLKLELEKEDTDLSIRYIVFGGEALKPNLIKGWYLKYPKTKLINMYGITETTVHVTFKELSETDLESSSSNIGVPIPTLHVIIVDKNSKLLPFGTIGEMCVLGEGVFKGYLNREDLNKTKLIKISEYSDKLIYRSGDTAIMHKDGHLEYMGRIDTQVKIRGFRVELGEIEEKILKYSNIDTCIVTKKIDEFDRELLCAYYIKNGPVNISALRIQLNNHLPSYMVPQYFIEIEKVPININGKTDFKSLPLPEKAQTGIEMIKPRNKVDMTLIEIYKKYLHIDNVSLYDSFFDLGGDSLSAISICEEINEKLNIEIKIKDILEKSIIINLSDYISKLESCSSNNCIILPAEKNNFYPTSSAQKRIYYSCYGSNKNSISYNLPGGILLEEVPDIEKLKECFDTLIQKHESFRTYFDLIDGNVVQKIVDKIDFKLNVYSANYKDLNSCFNKFLKPFDLEKAPLFRAELIKFENDKCLLLFDMHHIIADGTSLDILIEDLCNLYNNVTTSEQSLTYKDFAVWENNNLKNNNFEESKNYWLNQYNDEIPILNLPTNYTRPAEKSFKGAKIYGSIDNNLSEKIQQLANKSGVTPYMILLAAYYILLSKYSAQDDIIIGSPIMGRDNSQLLNIIGMFVNTLPLRAKIIQDSNFSEFLQNIKSMCLDSFEHQSYPVDSLINDLKIPRDNSRNPLFDVLFTYQNNGLKNFKLGDIKSNYYIPDTKISKFDLSLEIVHEKEILNFNFEYCTKLFNEDFIQNLSDHYVNILKIITKNENVKISDIDMLFNEEKNRILNGFNDTYLNYPNDKNLVDLFKCMVDKYSNNIAVQIGDKHITYKELDEKSNTLALKMLENGIKKGDVVGVCINKSIELVISIWAILKNSCTYMPMYVGYPKDRLEYMLENSNCKMLIVNSTMKNVIDIKCKVLDIMSFEKMKNIDNFNIPFSIEPTDLAYLIYTSGSTGKPKGVKIMHKNLINYIFSFNRLFENISSKDRFLSSTNISFDVSIWELFLPILNGSTLILYSEEIINNVIEYSRQILDYEITSLYIPPNILEEIYTMLKNHQDLKINKILVGVEPIKKSTLNKYYNLNPNLKIVNGYGPTETTICSTALQYQKSDDTDEIVSIGSPLNNTQIYIVDKNMQPVPIGVTGELCISGDGVGDGYINNAAETNKHFVKNPFNNNSKLYKTGDLAKWNSDGTITYISRKDSQIKFSGYRIELSEIDCTVMQYPSVSKCLTTVYTNGKKSYLVTYFTSQKNINKDDLSSYLQTKLAFYMVPTVYIQLESFPLTVNGKIDRKKLPIPEIKVKTEYVAPSTDLEKIICNIWQNLFGIKKIGIDDNFFDLGGDSLSAIRFQVEALNQNLNINYSDIFKFSTIRLLAQKAENSLPTEDKNEKEYDYTEINKLLQYNDINNIPKKIKLNKIGNVLLTGATGFLGAHILDSYLSNTSKGIVYCLVRRKDLGDPEERLKKTLEFYFGKKYTKLFGKRIKVITADITLDNFGLNPSDYEHLSNKINIVINSAALVKHYGDYTKFHSINVLGTQKLIDFCKTYNKKFYHISTTSVSGMGIPENNMEKTDEVTYFSEKDLYRNQNLNNTYIKTKFEAEKLILENINSGLNACILRMGNISNRYSDGKFQINVSENAFVNRIKSILKLQVLQEGFLQHSTEFAPVDLCADAIINIIKSNPKFTVFHIFNNKLISFKNLVKYINEIGIKLHFVSDQEFTNQVNKFLSDSNLKNDISGIITDLNKDRIFDLNANILIDTDFSNFYLQKLHFKWKNINKNYIYKYINYFKNINYFN